MTLGAKLAKLRKENNYTQEQLAERLGVSRQSISKWESDLAYPETEKLIRLGELFDCSLDYLLRESVESNRANQSECKPQPTGGLLSFIQFRERKSQKTWHGLPLWHIGKNAKGVFAFGLKAQGIVAVGLLARGVCSLGLLSLGLLSFGLFSLGLLAFGALSLGGLAVGAISVGMIALGAIALGIFSLGAISVGTCSVGALAIGKYIAIGDHARAAIALGDSEAVGSLFEKVGELTAEEIGKVKQLLDETVPSYLAWAKALIKLFIK